MLSLNELFAAFLDTLSGHLALVACLLAVTDERKVWERLKKLPLLLLSPAIAVLVSAGLQAVPELGICRYFNISFTILLMCTLWVRWVWRFGFWRAFAVTCMAGVFQVAAATLSFWALDENTRFAAAVGLHLAVSIAAALLLYRLRFGLWFRLLLESQSAPRRAALLLFALEISMELFLSLPNGIRPRYLPLYYLLAAVIVGLAAALVIYLARWSDTARKVRAQQDVIARQRLYEQDLENIRAEVRSFRHDCRNLLAGFPGRPGRGKTCAAPWSSWKTDSTGGWGRKYRRPRSLGICSSRKPGASFSASLPPCGRRGCSAAWRCFIRSRRWIWMYGISSAALAF